MGRHTCKDKTLDDQNQQQLSITAVPNEAATSINYQLSIADNGDTIDQVECTGRGSWSPVAIYVGVPDVVYATPGWQSSLRCPVVSIRHPTSDVQSGSDCRTRTQLPLPSILADLVRCCHFLIRCRCAVAGPVPITRLQAVYVSDSMNGQTFVRRLDPRSDADLALAPFSHRSRQPYLLPPARGHSPFQCLLAGSLCSLSPLHRCSSLWRGIIHPKKLYPLSYLVITAAAP